jgi:hypothetical protein
VPVQLEKRRRVPQGCLIEGAGSIEPAASRKVPIEPIDEENEDVHPDPERPPA